jgi:hypothetical protein
MFVSSTSIQCEAPYFAPVKIVVVEIDLMVPTGS